MLRLLGVMLSVLCLASPAPHSTGTPCPDISVLKETIKIVRNLISKGSSKVTPLNNTMEAAGSVTIYLEGFIEALKNSKEIAEQRPIVRNLELIQTYGESCTGWTSALKEHDWKAVEDNDFFNHLEYFLRFLGHNALPEKRT